MKPTIEPHLEKIDSTYCLRFEIENPYLISMRHYTDSASISIHQLTLDDMINLRNTLNDLIQIEKDKLNEMIKEKADINKEILKGFNNGN